jgi:hypothetical protein
MPFVNIVYDFTPTGKISSVSIYYLCYKIFSAVRTSDQLTYYIINNSYKANQDILNKLIIHIAEEDYIVNYLVRTLMPEVPLYLNGYIIGISIEEMDNSFGVDYNKKYKLSDIQRQEMKMRKMVSILKKRL